MNKQPLPTRSSSIGKYCGMKIRISRGRDNQAIDYTEMRKN